MPRPLLAHRQLPDTPEATPVTPSEQSPVVDGLGSIRATLQMHPVLWWLRESCALLLWAYVLVNALAFNVDAAIRQVAPDVGDALRFKGLAFLIMTAVAWLLLGNKRFWLTVGYVVAYPFVVVLWKVPKWTFSNWSLALAFLPALYTLSTAFRRTFVLGVLALASSVVVLVAPAAWAVAMAGGYLLLYLAIHYMRRFVGAFSRSTVFSAALKGVRKLRDVMTNAGVFARQVDANGEESESLARLTSGYAILSGLRIAAERLREVSDSRRMDLYLISSLVFTVVLTTVVFALVYVAVDRVEAGAFSTQGPFGFWPAVGYSFSTLMTSDLMGVQPVSALAKGLSLVEVSCSILLLILLVFVVLTSIRERYRADLNAIVDELRVAAGVAGKSLEREFSMTLREVEATLAESSSEVMAWLAEHDPAIHLLPGPQALAPPDPVPPDAPPAI